MTRYREYTVDNQLFVIIKEAASLDGNISWLVQVAIQTILTQLVTANANTEIFPTQLLTCFSILPLKIFSTKIWFFHHLNCSDNKLSHQEMCPHLETDNWNKMLLPLTFSMEKRKSLRLEKLGLGSFLKNYFLLLSY